LVVVKTPQTKGVGNAHPFFLPIASNNQPKKVPEILFRQQIKIESLENVTLTKRFLQEL
jgi:hypothetical protein